MSYNLRHFSITQIHTGRTRSECTHGMKWYEVLKQAEARIYAMEIPPTNEL